MQDCPHLQASSICVQCQGHMQQHLVQGKAINGRSSAVRLRQRDSAVRNLQDMGASGTVSIKGCLRRVA